MAVYSVTAQGFQTVSQPSIRDDIALQFPALAVGDFNGDGTRGPDHADYSSEVAQRA